MNRKLSFGSALNQLKTFIPDPNDNFLFTFSFPLWVQQKKFDVHFKAPGSALNQLKTLIPDPNVNFRVTFAFPLWVQQKKFSMHFKARGSALNQLKTAIPDPLANFWFPPLNSAEKNVE